MTHSEKLDDMQIYFSDRINQTSLKSFRLRSASYDPTSRPGRLDRQDIAILYQNDPDDPDNPAESPPLVWRVDPV